MKAVAIDGPVASGKTSTTLMLETLLGIPAIRSGDAFRALAMCLLKGYAAQTEDALIRRVANKTLWVEFLVENNVQTGILVHTDDKATYKFYGDELRGQDTGEIASRISLSATVRDAVKDAEQDIALRMPVVMEGRDICTAILPDADVKIFLTADLVERTERRLNQLQLDKVKDFWPTLEQIKTRDARDRDRLMAPLRPASNCVVLDNTTLTLQETALMIKALANARGIGKGA